MGSRTWFKIFADKWLTGTIREETPAVRGIFVDLLALAGGGRYGDTGEIKLSDDVGLTDGQIAAILKVPLELWLEAKKRFIETDRISIAEDNNIRITNWPKYQSEYERQKTFRGKSYTEELQPKVTTESYREKEREREKEKEKEKKSNTVIELDLNNTFFMRQSISRILRILRKETQEHEGVPKRTLTLYRKEVKRLGIKV